LTAIDESADTFTSNLSNSTGDLYTDGTAYTTVVSYVSTASAIDAAGLDGDDAVAITVCRDNNGNIVVTTYMNGTASSTSSTDTSDSETQSVTMEVNVYDATTVYTSMSSGSTIYGSIGSGNYSLSVGETMYIKLTASLTDFNTLMNGLGQESWSLENLVYGMQSYEITNPDSTVVGTSPSCASSGSDTVTFTITVTALSEGTATIGLDSFDGAYTITVTE
ncbi:MAG: hypothetical protein LUC20_04460, partial [Oscillospiraceae bacterium]|nr:hypothetical protein [Oscillospiraceae bacterium]